MATEVWSHASYLTPAIQNQRLRCALEKAMEVLAPHADRFDAIAFRGISGTIPGTITSWGSASLDGGANDDLAGAE